MKFPSLALSFALICSCIMPAYAGTALPAPSRTMYKCEVNGKISYSDAPCLGAQKITVEPTRGVSKITGTERVGQDVSHEKIREIWAEGLKPITGMDARQYEAASQANTRRMRLEPRDRAECLSLEHRIGELEESERKARYGILRQIQQELLTRRERYHEIGC